MPPIAIEFFSIGLKRRAAFAARLSLCAYLSLILRLLRDRNAFVVEALNRRWIIRRVGLEVVAIVVGAVDFRSFDGYVVHATDIDIVDQLRKGNLHVGPVGRAPGREKLSDDCVHRWSIQQQGDE